MVTLHNQSIGVRDTESSQALPIPIQFKLCVCAPDYPLEAEADAIADTVMQIPEQNFIQRKCSECKEEELQRKPLVSLFKKKKHHPGALIFIWIKLKTNYDRAFTFPTNNNHPLDFSSKPAKYAFRTYYILRTLIE